MPRYFDTDSDLRTTLAAEGVAPDIQVGSGEFGDPEIIRMTDGSWAYCDEPDGSGAYILIEEKD
jgi:hypothetical protein